jgi:hypothetical protein
MAVSPSIGVSGWLEEQLAQASPDLLRAMVATGGGRRSAEELDGALVPALLALVEPDERGSGVAAAVDDQVAAAPGRGAGPAGHPVSAPAVSSGQWLTAR